MRRRALLSLSGLALAGCLSTPGSENTTTESTVTPEPTSPPPTEPSPSDTTPADSSSDGTPTEPIGVPAAESDCPDVADRVVCVPEVDPESAPIALTADSRSGSLPTTFEFTLANETDATLSTNYYAWKLWKRVDDEWVHIAPEMVQQPLMRLRPGSSHDWTLTAEHELPEEPGRYYMSWESEGTVSGLGGGEYAFTVDGWFGDSSEETVGFAVLFDVDAPELTLEPTTRVSDSSREGNTVTVHGEGNSDEERRAEFVLSRVDDADDPQRTSPEQAAHDYRLRNTLPYFEQGVEQVRYVEENHGSYPAFGTDEPYTLSYRGELYEASANELEGGTETN